MAATELNLYAPNETSSDFFRTCELNKFVLPSSCYSLPAVKKWGGGGSAGKKKPSGYFSPNHNLFLLLVDALPSLLVPKPNISSFLGWSLVDPWRRRRWRRPAETTSGLCFLSIFLSLSTSLAASHAIIIAQETGVPNLNQRLGKSYYALQCSRKWTERERESKGVPSSPLFSPLPQVHFWESLFPT